MRKATRLVAAGLALATLAGCKPLDDTMVLIFGRSMRDQRSFDPYENPLPAPQNSVAFSAGNLAAEPHSVNVGQPEGVDVTPFGQADMIPIGTGNDVVAGLINPIPMDDEVAMARGEQLFLRNCAVCHGANGMGANAYIVTKHPTLVAYNLAGPVVAGYTDPYIYGMIRVGRGLMPAYGPRIGHFDRWKIVNYVRLLQQQAGTTGAGN